MIRSRGFEGLCTNGDEVQWVSLKTEKSSAAAVEEEERDQEFAEECATATAAENAWWAGVGPAFQELGRRWGSGCGSGCGCGQNVAMGSWDSESGVATPTIFAIRVRSACLVQSAAVMALAYDYAVAAGEREGCGQCLSPVTAIGGNGGNGGNSTANSKRAVVCGPGNIGCVFVACVAIATKFAEDRPTSNRALATAAGLSPALLAALELRVLARLRFDLARTPAAISSAYAAISSHSVRAPQAPQPQPQSRSPQLPSRTTPKKQRGTLPHLPPVSRASPDHTNASTCSYSHSDSDNDSELSATAYAPRPTRPTHAPQTTHALHMAQMASRPSLPPLASLPRSGFAPICRSASCLDIAALARVPSPPDSANSSATSTPRRTPPLPPIRR
eukprot:TRINITY_DN5644_c0_g1_i1.p1 TRINITY_DN5644_c0_g1~~TRINITY_DN5644_c0_g1_i1.p1  ORF type:complete len:389 (-),score=47.89 TRINITY_DN5644_c0_g1_i1:321-1487(-)